MIRVILLVLLIAFLAALAIALAHTDTPAVITPPLTPITSYGDRQ